MNNKGYIAKKKEGDSLFEELRLEALNTAQKLCSAVWTDYNEHDPGVTLLENIAYALTELMYKISLPIQDLLIKAEGVQLRSGDNGLFVASDILTTGPITFKDYRKIWINQIENVENVWIRPVNEQQDPKKGAKGLLHVLVEKYEDKPDPEEESKENKRIIHEVERLYQGQRNICEDLYQVEICASLDMTMELEATITQEVYGEDILAEILYRVDDYLTPSVNYYSLWELQQKKVAVNNIFNGPHLPTGFIAESEFKDPLREVSIPELIKKILQIPGIVHINYLRFHYTSPTTGEAIQIKDHFQIPKNTVLRISFPQSNEKLIFKSAGVSFRPDLTRTRKQLSMLVAAYYQSFQKASGALNTLPIPKGQYRDITSYYPIRKQLPELYGVGDRRISPQATPLRQAQMKQLQAYLMPFDQLMANFLAQLRHIYTLFDTHSTQEASYFSQVLPDVEQLPHLVQHPEEVHDPEKIKAHWKRLLKDLNARFDTHALTRHHQIADHLLARFNEVFRTYSPSKINSISYGVPMHAEDNEKALLAAKRKLLREYASISYRRAQSFHYHRIAEIVAATGECSQTELLPSALQKTAILTGMDDFAIKSLIKNLETSGITIHPENVHIELIVREITPLGEGEELLEIENVKIKEDIKENLHQVMHYAGHHDTILETTLKHGVLARNYAIQQDKDKNVYYVFHTTGNAQAIAHIASSREEAQEAIQKAIHYLKEVSRKSEGFFAVEHLLLMPPYHGRHYGFHIDFSVFSEALNVEIQQRQRASYLKRNKTIDTLKEQLLSRSLTYSTRHEKGRYKLEIRSSSGAMLAVSKTEYPSPKEVAQQIKAMEDIPDTWQEDQWDTAVKRYAYYGHNHVDECCFAFQLSIIAPTWPVRFQEENFKRLLENTLHKQLPIHIKSTVFWLNYDNLCKFEDHYFQWMQRFLKEHNARAWMPHAYALITMLQDLNQQNEEEKYRVA